MKKSAKTKFIFIKSKDWKAIDKTMTKKRCLRCGIIKADDKGVLVLCAS